MDTTTSSTAAKCSARLTATPAQAAGTASAAEPTAEGKSEAVEEHAVSTVRSVQNVKRGIKRASGGGRTNATAKKARGGPSTDTITSGHDAQVSVTLPPWPSRRRIAPPATSSNASSDKRAEVAGGSSCESPSSGASNERPECVTVTLRQSRKKPPLRRALNPMAAYTTIGEVSTSARHFMQRSNVLTHYAPWTSFPSRMREVRVSTALPNPDPGPGPKVYDKAFCSEWVDSDTIAVGTKCGSVLRVSRSRLSVEVMDVPDQCGDALVADTMEDNIVDDLFSGDEGTDPGPTHVNGPQLYQTLMLRQLRGGIHAVARNASGTLLAVSGHRNGLNAAYVLDLNHPRWNALHRAYEHTDWIFGVAWVRDNCFVTAGRDGLVALWDVNHTRASSSETGDNFNLVPVGMYRDIHHTKVRCISHDPASERLASCDTDGVIALWDPVTDDGSMRVLRHIQMSITSCNEIACLHLAADLLTIGSRTAVSMYDPRSKTCSGAVAELPTLGWRRVAPFEGEAVRSVSCKGPLIGAGMASGKIFFFDKRMLGRGRVDTLSASGAESAPLGERPTELPRWLVTDTPAASLMQVQGSAKKQRAGLVNLSSPPRMRLRPRHSPSRLQARGTLSATPPPEAVSQVQVLACDVENDEVYYLPYNFSSQVKSAIFHHTWAPDGSELFACGGPLAVGLRGCYMGFWR